MYGFKSDLHDQLILVMYLRRTARIDTFLLDHVTRKRLGNYQTISYRNDNIISAVMVSHLVYYWINVMLQVYFGFMVERNDELVLMVKDGED